MFSQLMIKAVNVSVENFTYLDDIFSRQWESIVRLSDAKYQWTIELIDKYLETWPNFAHALPAILADVIDPGDLSIPRVQRFSQLLLQAIELQKSYPGTWDVMLDNLTRHRMGLNGLNDAKFQWVMEFMSAELKDILRYPQVFDVILGYVTTPDLSFERAQLLASLVLLAISYQDAHPEQRAVDYLIAELERIRGPLMVLSEERFIKIIDLTSTHLETWFKYPQLLPQVLDYLCELRFSTARSLSLSQSLLNAIAHVTASPESIDYSSLANFDCCVLSQ